MTKKKAAAVAAPKLSRIEQMLSSLPAEQGRIRYQEGIFTGTASQAPSEFSDGSGVSCIFHSSCGAYKHTLLASFNSEGKLPLLQAVADDNECENALQLFDGRAVTFYVTSRQRTASLSAHKDFKANNSSAADAKNSKLASKLASRRR